MPLPWCHPWMRDACKGCRRDGCRRAAFQLKRTNLWHLLLPSLADWQQMLLLLLLLGVWAPLLAHPQALAEVSLRILLCLFLLVVTGFELQPASIPLLHWGWQLSCLLVAQLCWISTTVAHSSSLESSVSPPDHRELCSETLVLQCRGELLLMQECLLT